MCLVVGFFMFFRSGRLTFTSKSTSTMESYTLETQVKMIEDLQVSVNACFGWQEGFVQRLLRDHPELMVLEQVQANLTN